MLKHCRHFIKKSPISVCQGGVCSYISIPQVREIGQATAPVHASAEDMRLCHRQEASGSGSDHPLPSCRISTPIFENQESQDIPLSMHFLPV